MTSPGERAVPRRVCQLVEQHRVEWLAALEPLGAQDVDRREEALRHPVALVQRVVDAFGQVERRCFDATERVDVEHCEQDVVRALRLIEREPVGQGLREPQSLVWSILH